MHSEKGISSKLLLTSLIYVISCLLKFSIIDFIIIFENGICLITFEIKFFLNILSAIQYQSFQKKILLNLINLNPIKYINL